MVTKEEIAEHDKCHLLDPKFLPEIDTSDGYVWPTYADALEATGVKVLDYNQFGDYQGLWLARIQFPNGEIYFTSGNYGSCSGCDAIQAEFDYDATENYAQRLHDFGWGYISDCRTKEEVLALANDEDSYWYYYAQADSGIADWVNSL